MFFFSDNIQELKFDPISEETAYLLILQDDLDGARVVFEKLDTPRAKWGRALVDIIKGYIEEFPAYFEIRNFFEIDMDFLLKNEKISYVEQMLGALDFLCETNQEVYKFAARVLMENKLFNAAKKYLDKSKSVFYNDPELHFLFTKYYLRLKEYHNAEYHIKECLKILPEYYPAKKILADIQEYLV